VNSQSLTLVADGIVDGIVDATGMRTRTVSPPQCVTRIAVAGNARTAAKSLKM
jgi:hypothetical protein